ncbi:lamin tail domain-containing protein [Lacihabitans sp. LS3-19]|uniref:lamin tail domain-containing protein n=1 Tax=Lacihabitans sp. LS3-19 TaxID=2487335 RepID=UPI0020CEA367|nr:lamin tail domain-containing protein [Lacihabitans sp. LS3-19]
MKLKIFFFLFAIQWVCIAQSNEIIITEIFADPTPSHGLPEREYIEIFNATSKDISLKGFKFLYGNFSATFPDSILKSHSYAIVCRKGYESDFRPFGKVIALSNFSLTNDGNLLVLKTSNEEDVFFVNYSSSWYADGFDQGYSLEMIDMNFPCVGKANWTSSLSTNGGSPGITNTVNGSKPDLNGPTLLNSSLDENTIVLNFDENLSESFLQEQNSFEIVEGDNKIKNVVFQKYFNSKVTINIESKLEIGESIKLLIKNVEDCSGNLSEDIYLDFRNLLPAKEGEIQLSEILFNPKTGGEDFVELYNMSENTLNLKGWSVARLDIKGEVVEVSELSDFDLIIQPKGFIAFTENKSFLIQNYPNSGNLVEIPKMPSFNNDQGTVILYDSESKEFDRFTYSEKMHQSSIVNPDGVSLERKNFKDNSDFWFSASADAGFATPGMVNSQTENDQLKNTFSVEPIVFNPYQPGHDDFTNIHYKLNESGSSAYIEVLDKNGKSVRILHNNLVLGTEGKISWDGKDNQGEILPVGYYVFNVKLFSKQTSESYLIKTVIGSNY